jgi:radical SAM superfamily enzyme YgiQ (UPF0313 family)
MNAPANAPGDILLISCYELGHQPLNLASPLAFLARAGYAASALDTSVAPLDEDVVRRAHIVAISVPMHTALRLAVPIARRVRLLNPTARIVFYGLYASLNAEYLLRDCADAVIGGEYEQALVEYVRAVDAGTAERGGAGITVRGSVSPPSRGHLAFVAGNRGALPPLARYAQLQTDGERVLAGYVEATRGCLHTCAHCPITPVYQGRFVAVPREVVLADIRQQVAAGARHITFGDPDFLNGPTHSLRILRAMHAELPELSFDATIKIEHILEHAALFPELRALGCAFVVTAVESLSPVVLAHLRKGHTAADVVAALAIAEDAGIPLRPSLVSFTPWTTLDDFITMLDFVGEHELVEQVDPVQYTIRLLVPPGSALLEDPTAHAWLGPLDEEAFTYRWEHPDARVDALHGQVSRLVEQAQREARDHRTVFREVRALALRVAGRVAREPDESLLAPLPRARVLPHLTEAWFC